MMKNEFARGIYKQNQIVLTAFWKVHYRRWIIRNYSITSKYVVNDTVTWYVFVCSFFGLRLKMTLES